MSNQLAFTVGGEIGVAPRKLGLSRAFMPYLGAYYKSVEFYEDLAHDQEEESWETWGFNHGFMSPSAHLETLPGCLRHPERQRGICSSGTVSGPTADPSLTLGMTEGGLPRLGSARSAWVISRTDRLGIAGAAASGRAR